MKRKTGGERKKVQIRLTHEQDEALERMAEREHRSKSNMLSWLVEQAIQAEEEQSPYGKPPSPPKG